MIIAPSILACDFLNIESELRRFDGLDNIWLHLDIMDGHFVPNLTFGHAIVELIAKKTHLPLDAHFMVTNPEFYIDTFKSFKIHNFTFHYEVYETNLLELKRLIKKAKDFYPSVGLSIKPNTDVTVLTDDILTMLDLVLVMSVEPGFGGQKFMPNCLDKIKFLNSKKLTLFPNLQIQVDGGINEVTAKEVIAAGATNLVAGSAIFKYPSSQTSVGIKKLLSHS